MSLALIVGAAFLADCILGVALSFICWLLGWDKYE